MTQTVSADTLLAALAKKHSDAVFVPECKNGPTQLGSHRRFDAWVLLKTWSPVTTIGYEIKVDRKDWRRDDKIAEYMGLCHQLYIVAPKAVVPLEEIPDGIGLLEFAGAGRLVTRRKAARREIDMPVSLMVYVLMCRASIGKDSTQSSDQSWRLSALRQWAEEKDDRKRLHYALSAKIRRSFDAQEDEIERVRRRISELEHIEHRIVELGFDPAQDVRRWEVTKRLDTMAATVSPSMLRKIKQAEDQLGDIRQSLERLQSVDQKGITIG